MALPRLGLVAASHAEQEGLFSLINCKWLIINLTRRRRACSRLMRPVQPLRISAHLAAVAPPAS